MEQRSTDVLSADIAPMSIVKFTRTEILKQLLQATEEPVERSKTPPDYSEIAAKLLAKIQAMKARRSSE
jgi:hypothetical protein